MEYIKTSIKTLYKLLKISIYFMEIIRNIYKNLFWKISIRKILKITYKLFMENIRTINRNLLW